MLTFAPLVFSDAATVTGSSPSQATAAEAFTRETSSVGSTVDSTDREEKTPSDPFVESSNQINRSLDTSHLYVSRSVDQLAIWLDRFLGGREVDYDAHRSLLRLRYGNVFEEDRSRKDDLALRVKLRLPNTEDRLNLIINSDVESQDGVETARDGRSDEDSVGEVALQLEAIDRKSFDLKYRVGFKSGPRLRTGVRARYRRNLSETWLMQLRPEIFWLDQFGFGSRVDLELNRNLSANNLLGFKVRLDFNEDEAGVPWETQLALTQLQSNKSVLSSYVIAYGQTRPGYLTEAYGPGLLYRRTLGKPWIFVELEPQYLWKREKRETERDGKAIFILRFEMVFDEELGRYWH